MPGEAKTYEEKLAAADDRLESAAADLAKANEAVTERAEFVAKGFELAGSDLDFSKPKVLAHFDAGDSDTALKKLRGYNDEAGLLGINRDAKQAIYASAKAAVEALIEESKGNGQGAGGVQTPPWPDAQHGAPTKGIGQIVMDSKMMKEYKLSKSPGSSIEEGFGLKELKTTFSTSAGWAPETTRVPGLVVPYAERPIQILDIIPTGRTGQAAVVYMYESTSTHASAERNEAAAYAESQFALTETSSTVRSIGASVPVTDEQLEDVEGVQSYLENKLMFGNRQRLDYEVIQGDGVAPNLTGILNNGDIQTQAKSIDPVPDAVYKAMTKVRVTGRAIPNAFAVHQNDWQSVRLLRTNDGVYIWGSPSEAGPERIWGIQVVQSDILTENTGLVGDFANFCQLYERRGMEVLIGWDSDDFTKGIRTIRAGLRVAFAIYRGAAFCTVTGI